jgi:hypothetical protein
MAAVAQCCWLGVSMSGEKLAPLVVFKGVPDARIIVC